MIYGHMFTDPRALYGIVDVEPDNVEVPFWQTHLGFKLSQAALFGFSILCFAFALGMFRG